MKSIIFSAVLLLAASNAFAITKNCDGASNDSNTKGDKMSVEITQSKVEIAEGGFTGTYPISKADVVRGKDGKTYLNYDTPTANEGCDTLLVDEDLLKVKGKGWIKFRCRGESFEDTKYYCKP